MKISLEQARKLINWIDEHKEVVDQFFPKVKDMKMTLPKIRGHERDLVETVIKPEDDSE